MHSFLIASKNTESLLEKAYQMCSEKKIDKFDINLLESDKQIGISDVKNIQAKAYLKPIKSAEKALIISAVLGLTIEAQNALLKLLEEPPKNTVIILLLESTDSVLPTIRSRCKIIKLNLKPEKEENNQKYLKLLNSLSKMEVGERLKIAEGLSKSKEEAIKTIEKLILISRTELLEKQSKELTERINKLSKTYTIIKNTNVNMRLALENLFLNI